jgi:hypothetical protein
MFKGAAMQAGRSSNVLGDLYQGLLSNGMKPAMARLTLARKIAAIVLKIWKTGGPFDPRHVICRGNRLNGSLGFVYDRATGCCAGLPASRLARQRPEQQQKPEGRSHRESKAA